jgi:hypothetical protein
MRHREHEGAAMKDMKVTASRYDFRPAQAAMQRYVDGNLLSGLSSAVLVGRDLAARLHQNYFRLSSRLAARCVRATEL